MDYLDYFGFASEPFGHAPLPRFYYASEQHTNALSRLMHAANAMKGLAVLLGDIGRGKTTLARRMLDSLPENQFEAAMLVIVHKGITPNWLLKRIALQVGVPDPADDKLTILSQLYQRLVQIHQSGRKAVVLIDEAQMLSSREVMEEFRGLLNLEVPGHKLISFVFFGLPSLSRCLELDPPLAQRVAMRFRLGTLTVEDTSHYVQHRMRLSGGDLDIFTPESLDEIHRHSSGVPRLINTLCDNTLLELFFNRQQHASREVVTEVAENLALPAGGGNEESEDIESETLAEAPAVEGGPGSDAIVAFVRNQDPGVAPEDAIDQMGFSAEDIAARVAEEPDEAAPPAAAAGEEAAGDEPLPTSDETRAAAEAALQLPSHQPVDHSIPDVPVSEDDEIDIADPLAFLDSDEHGSAGLDDDEDTDLASATAAVIAQREAAGELVERMPDEGEIAVDVDLGGDAEVEPADEGVDPEPAGEEVDAAVVEALAAGDGSEANEEKGHRAFAADVREDVEDADGEVDIGVDEDWIEVASEEDDWEDAEVGDEIELAEEVAVEVGEEIEEIEELVDLDDAEAGEGDEVPVDLADEVEVPEAIDVDVEVDATDEVREASDTEEETLESFDVDLDVDDGEAEEEAEAEVEAEVEAQEIDVAAEELTEPAPIDLDDDIDVEIPSIFDEDIEEVEAVVAPEQGDDDEELELPAVFDEALEDPAPIAAKADTEDDDIDLDLSEVFDEDETEEPEAEEHPEVSSGDAGADQATQKDSVPETDLAELEEPEAPEEEKPAAAAKPPKKPDFDLGFDLDALTGDLSSKKPTKPREPRPTPAAPKAGERPARKKDDNKERRITTTTGKVIDLGEIDDLLADLK